jgi:hypothetical protein
MGGDCCHFAGVFRPTDYVPLPLHLPTSQLDSYFPSPCPCSIFTPHHPASQEGSLDSSVVRTQPFYRVSQVPESAYVDGHLAQQSVDLLRPIDASPHVFICLAHDGVLLDLLPLFNQDPTKDINDWQDQGYKDRSHWGFLNELPKGNKPGRNLLVTESSRMKV